ncbi:MAG: transglycosylase SLT domain-containing protein [Methylococcales bacterium]|nr:transglycosylase SLT domain-containing protein [Methylococcales bacterium]
MRFLILVFNILVGSVMLSQPTEVLADSVDNKTSKNTSLRGHSRSKGHGSRQHRVRQKLADNPGDVWERMRAGMQIPRPSPAQPELSLAQNSNNLPKAVVSGQTRLPTAELHKVNALILSEINTVQGSVDPRTLPKQTLAPKYKSLSRLTSPQTRIRTQIDRYPQLHKQIFTANFTGRALPQIKSIRTENSFKTVITQRPAGLGAHNPADNLKEVRKQDDIAIGMHRTSGQAARHERVNKHIIWYSQHRDYLRQVAERARPYLYHIVESLNKHKLPSELALLPIVESAYQPTAQSPKSAAGLWQFIPGTGHDFDLEQTRDYDDRLDITASTEAAMRYLSFLKQHYHGDWLLALAAYNCGLGAVDAAINRNSAEGLGTDYWSLRLPEETQEYVPRFLALSSIFANPADHGLKLAPVRNKPYFVKVKIDRKSDIQYLAEKDLSEIAQLADLSYEQFTRLNPGYLNSKLATTGPFTLLMPSANANQFHQRLASVKQFFDEPVLSVARIPLKKETLATADAQKAALPLLTEIKLPAVAVSDLFLSLNLGAGQTSPRVTADLLQAPFSPGA